MLVIDVDLSATMARPRYRMKAEFKEKTYEKYFSSELARLTNITYSPDQVDEFFLGFDDAFFLRPDDILRWPFPFMRPSRRRRLLGMTLSELDFLAAEMSELLPPFKFNLFVQYKRPEYLSRRSAQEWACWDAPYFRYFTTPHQQQILEAINTQSHGRSATVYASPAFWRANDLWSIASNERIVANSNIASVARLNGHTTFTYSTAGNMGKGHSEPVTLESVALEALLASGLEQSPMPLVKHMTQTAEQVRSAVAESSIGAPLFELARTATLKRSPFGERLESSAFASAAATLEAFSDAFGVAFYAMG